MNEIFLIERVESQAGTVFNIAGDTTISVIDLIKKAQRILGVKIPYRIENSQKNEIPYQHLSWEKIRTLGWKPEYALSDGLKETYEWYKTNRIG